jgi:hypothetical protein
MMLTRAVATERTGKALDNQVLRKAGRVTFVGALLAAAVLIHATLRWWWL